MKHLQFLLCSLILCVVVHAQTTQTPTTLYISPNAQGHYYRIPALATANDGSIIMVTDMNYNNNKDLGNHQIDMFVRRSIDNGANWGPDANISSSITNSTTGCCDPAIVADCESGDVLILAATGSNQYQLGKVSVHSFRSSDNGQTWSTPQNITSTIYGFNSNWESLFFASGRICQSRTIKVGTHYRIYTALLARNGFVIGNLNKYGNEVLYSDDFGTTWHRLNQNSNASPIYLGDEAKVEELPDGSVLLSSRKGGGRYYNRYVYTDINTGAGNWTGAQEYNFGGSASCNGEILKVKARHTSGREVNLLLQTLPIDSDRKNICLYYKVLEDGYSAITGWSTTSYVITPNYGAYSTLCVQPDGRIGIYWEDNFNESDGNEGYCMRFNSYDLSTLVPGYTLALPKPNVRIGTYASTCNLATKTLTINVPNTINLTQFVSDAIEVDLPLDVRNSLSIFTVSGDSATATLTLSDGNYNESYRLVVKANNDLSVRNTWLGLSDAWNNSVNWSKGTIPILGEDVEIPGGLSMYPELTNTTNAVCNNIFIAAGGRLGGSFRLTYSALYCEVKVRNDRWVRVSMPIQEVVSGDFYTHKQGGGYLDPSAYPYTASAYNNVFAGNGVTAANRIYPGSTYQRIFSKLVPVIDGEPIFETEWSEPYNALNYVYGISQGFDVWIDNEVDSFSVFHLPASDTAYNYFYNNGNMADRTEQVTRSSATGKFAYETDDHTYGVLEFLEKREQTTEELSSMFVIGNPAFAYLDVVDFLNKNGTVTPFIYRHVSSKQSDGSEVVLYYNKTQSQLFKITGAITEGDLPATSPSVNISLNDSLRYIEPTTAFRVMGGSPALACIEPKLLGYYENAFFNMAVVNYQIEEGALWWKEWVTYSNSSYISGYATSQGESLYKAPLSITATEDPYKVRIGGLVGQVNVIGTIDPIAQTITIDNATPASFISSSSWSCSSDVTLNLYGASDASFEWSSNYIEYRSTRRSKYPTNLGANIVFNYNYNENTKEFTITSTNPFALFDNQTPSGYRSNNTSYPIMFFCFQNISASKKYTTGEEHFIHEDGLGSYTYVTAEKKASDCPNNDVSVTVTIRSVVGTYNMVTISGIHPSSPDVSVIGQITKDGSDYFLTISGGQLVHNSSSITNNYYLYSYKSRETPFRLKWTTGATNTWRNEDNLKAMVSHLNTDITSNNGFASSERFTLTQQISGTSGSDEDTYAKTDDCSTLFYKFTASMFHANLPLVVSPAPAQKSANEVNTVATIIAANNGYAVNTLLYSCQGASNGYRAKEDALLVDAYYQDMMCLATMAESYPVAVNNLYRPDSVKLFYTASAGNTTFTFNELGAIADTTYLYDALTETTYLLDNRQSVLSFQTGSSDEATRFVLLMHYAQEAPTGNVTAQSSELLKAMNPTGGVVQLWIEGGDLIANASLYNAAGQLLDFQTVNATHLEFSNLPSGVYMVTVRTGNGKAFNKKVVVK